MNSHITTRCHVSGHTVTWSQTSSLSLQLRQLRFAIFCWSDVTELGTASCKPTRCERPFTVSWRWTRKCPPPGKSYFRENVFLSWSWQAATAQLLSCDYSMWPAGRPITLPQQTAGRQFNIRSANFKIRHWSNPDKWAMLLCVDWLGFITERKCVYCAVRTEYIYVCVYVKFQLIEVVKPCPGSGV